MQLLETHLQYCQWNKAFHCCLDLMKPDVDWRMQNTQKAQIPQQNSDRMPNFEVGQTVLAKNYGRGSWWVIAVVHKQTGSIPYVVTVGNTYWKKHLHQLQPMQFFIVSRARNGIFVTNRGEQNCLSTTQGRWYQSNWYTQTRNSYLSRAVQNL